MRVLSSTLQRNASCPCRLPCIGWSCAVSACVLVCRIARRHNTTTQPTASSSCPTTQTATLTNSRSNHTIITTNTSGSLLAEVLRRRGDIPVPEWVTHAKARWRTPHKPDTQYTSSSSCSDDRNVVGVLCPRSSRAEGEAERTPYVPLLLRPPIASHQQAEVQEDDAAPLVDKGTSAEQGMTSEDRHASTQQPTVEETCDAVTTEEEKVRYATRCITDPLEWLAQAPETPLTDPAVLQEYLPYDRGGSSSVSTSSAMGELDITADNLQSNIVTRERKKVQSQREDDDAVGEDRLVFNVFTRRVAKARSTSIQALRVLGITVDETCLELRLSDEQALCALASELRSGHVSWPTSWANGSHVFRQLERLVRHTELAVLPMAVRTLLTQLYAMWHRRRQAGLIIRDAEEDDGGGNNNDAVCDDAMQQTQSVDSNSDVRDIVKKPSIHALHMRAIEAPQRWDMAELNSEQRALVEFALQGYCTYIGGGAGSGKSVLLRVLRQEFLRRGLAVAMTATTGIASCQIGGCTLHHCFGINAHGDFTRRGELAAYDVIIIDEVSMLAKELFESLEHHLRRANGVDLPFGGVQVILCGDFMQLGAIGAGTILTSRVFRHNFAMVKLEAVVRQSENALYAQQLQSLRRGQVPSSLASTVAFLTTEQVLLEKWRSGLLRVRQQRALAALETKNTTQNASTKKEEEEHILQDGGYVPGAVNLLPTNAQVEETNRRELERLPADAMTFAAQVLSPTLLGTWSATYILRVTDATTTNTTNTSPERVSATAASRLHSRVHATLKHFVNLYMLQRKSHYASPLDERHMVLYPLFRDALAFRLRVPEDFDDSATQELAQHLRQLEQYINESGLPVRVCELMDSAEGLHTERDGLILSAYAMQSPMSHGVTLKLGCRVMLRANLSSQLVNGSVGTVVGLRQLRSDLIPRYLLSSAAREEGVDLYADFLAHECGFPSPVVPEVLFDDGRREVIPPISYYVGGLANTHHYSLRILALPLTLAYAFTVHKVQGLTLVGRVHLELSRMWPCDHLLYVAMSRVRNPEQLSIANFRRELVQVAAGCLLFDDSLPSVEAVRVLPSFIPATWVRDPRRRKKELRRRRLQREVAQHRNKQEVAQSARRTRRGGLEQQIRRIQEQMLHRGK